MAHQQPDQARQLSDRKRLRKCVHVLRQVEAHLDAEGRAVLETAAGHLAGQDG